MGKTVSEGWLDRKRKAIDLHGSTAISRVSKFPNTRCSPERFCEMAAALSDQQKIWVNEMGFGDLICLSLRKIDRYLCLWLMRRFDPEHGRLFVRDDYHVDIDSNDVGWVLGIPGPNKPVPKTTSSEMLSRLKQKYRNHKGIDEKTPFDIITANDIGERDFKEAFLLYTLGVLLCPTQSWRINPKHLKVLSTCTNAYRYNWCQYVFDWLLVSARKFKHSRSLVGGYGGCAVFLMIFYLDRLKTGSPINWSISTSRVDAWTTKAAHYLLIKDRKAREEFGNAEVVRNVIYGKEYPVGKSQIRWEEIRAIRGPCETRSTLIGRVRPGLNVEPASIRFPLVISL